MAMAMDRRVSESNVTLVMQEEPLAGAPAQNETEEEERWDNCLPSGCCLRDFSRIITFIFLMLSILFDVLAMTTPDWMTYTLDGIHFDHGMPWGTDDFLLSGLQRGIMGASVMAAIFSGFAAFAIIFECLLWYCQGMRMVLATAALIFAAFFLMLLVWVFGIALAILSATSQKSNFGHLGYSYWFSFLSSLVLLPCTITYVRKCLTLYAQEEIREAMFGG